MKRTPWFPPEVEPVRVGWYERDYGHLRYRTPVPARDWWMGDGWILGYTMQPISFRPLPWRGLTEPA